MRDMLVIKNCCCKVPVLLCSDLTLTPDCDHTVKRYYDFTDKIQRQESWSWKEQADMIKWTKVLERDLFARV